MATRNKIELEQAVEQVNEFLNSTADARLDSELSRDYYDGKQWTAKEIEVLRKRGQAPIVNNRIKPKIEAIKGFVSLKKSDPKAYPRTQKHEDAAFATTDALRYVTDNNDFDERKIAVVENVLIEGYGGALVDIIGKAKGEIEINIREIPWDRIYYDPHARKRDFSDARYMGEMVWLDEDELKDLFPDADIDEVINRFSDGETFEDRPHWIDSSNKNRRRVRIARHFYKKSDKWYACFFTETAFLIEPQESPYLDDEGLPTNPIELVGAYIDRENQRYGEVKGFIDLQNEINHRRSKALYLLSSRQTAGRKGAVDDIKKLKRELKKPDGHVEWIGEKAEFEILPTNDMGQAQFELLQEAKAELDSTSFNAQLSGERQMGDLSGIAIERLQYAGTMELNSLLKGITNWEKRIYRQIFARIKQFWDSEKWIRITDDQDNLKWVGLNSQVMMIDLLKETIEDESKPLEMRVGANAVLQNMVSNNDPRLQQIVDVRNDVSDLDVDIILDQSFDMVNVQQEQFKLLAQFGQGSGIDIIDLIEMSELRNKKEIIERIQNNRQAAAQDSNSAVQLEAMKVQADTQETLSNTAFKEQQAIEKKLTNMKLMNGTEDIVKLQDIAAKTSKTIEEAIQKKVETNMLITQPVDKSPQIVV